MKVGRNAQLSKRNSDSKRPRVPSNKRLGQRKHRSRRQLTNALQRLEDRHLLTFAIDLVSDINLIGESSSINQYVEMNDVGYFVANDGLSGGELWKTDGTSAGTSQVKDIVAGPVGGQPEGLTVLDGELFFIALDEGGETNLWKSDGTESGTVMVYDANEAGVYSMDQLTKSGDQLFFTAYEENSGYELWRSDGTSNGTVLVEDINPDATAFGRPEDLTDVDGTLFFTSYEDSDYNRELWKSDGTAAGTMMVVDLTIDPADGGELSTVSSYPSYLTNVDGTLFFAAYDLDHGIELFKSDGTANGTILVDDLNPGSADSDPLELTAFGNSLLFSARDSAGNRHVYRANDQGIELIADTTGGLGSSSPAEFTVAGNEVFFAANGSRPLTQVVADQPDLNGDNTTRSGGFAGIFTSVNNAFQGTLSDAAGSSTVSTVAQCCSDDGPGFVDGGTARIGSAGVALTNIEVGDFYIQSIGSGELDQEYWDWTISDDAGLSNIDFSGFISGNQMDNGEVNEGVTFTLYLNEDFNTPVSTWQVPGDSTGDAIDNWYGARDGDNLQLSNSGGSNVTAATVRMTMGVNGANVFPDGGSEAFLINAQLTADLSANTTQRVPLGRELHRTDGSPQGTAIVKDIVPVGSSNPSDLVAVGNNLFFSADDVVGTGRELWFSDGSDVGTTQMVDSLQGVDLYGAPLDGAPELLGEINGELIFTTTNQFQDRELWLSDGTDSSSNPGTRELKNINLFTEDSEVNDLYVVGTDIFFAANDGINGETLLKMDTTTDTVTQVFDASPSSADQISELNVLDPVTGTALFYSNTTGVNGQIYLLDPANLATPVTALAAQQPIELDEDGTRFVVYDSWAYFVSSDSTAGIELWRINAAGSAQRLTDMIPGIPSSEPRSLATFNQRIYFSADTHSSTPEFGNIGRELFAYDPEQEIVELAADLRMGTSDGNPAQLTVMGNKLFFTGTDGTNGDELWYLDFNGTKHPLTDIRVGGGSSLPRHLTVIDDILYFSAASSDLNFEPYRTDGTLNGTYRLADIQPGGGGSDPRDFTKFGGEVYFSAGDLTNGRELWRSDGTENDATLVIDLLPGTSNSNPVPLADNGHRLIFSAQGQGIGQQELWVTDRSAERTFLIDDLNPIANQGSSPTDMVQVNGVFYFAADNGRTGQELFRMDQVAPAVESIVTGGDHLAPVEETQRSIVDRVSVTFDSQVDLSGAAFELTNVTTNTVVTTVLVDLRVENEKTIAELTFAAGPGVDTRGTNHSLADGNYELRIVGIETSSTISGTLMVADDTFGDQPTDNFFRLFGELGGDGLVDGGDLASFLGGYLNAPGYTDDLDFDGDGDIDGVDYGAFSRRLSTSR